MHYLKYELDFQHSKENMIDSKLFKLNWTWTVDEVYLSFIKNVFLNIFTETDFRGNEKTNLDHYNLYL